MLGHHALIYSSPAEFLDVAVSFVRAGIDQGDAVVVASPQAPALAAALGATRDRVELVDDRDWHRVPAWTIGLYARRAQRSVRDGARLRALSEPPSDDEWHRYEAVLNHALADLPVELCCAYDGSALGEAALDAARHTHPTSLGARGVESMVGYVDTALFLADRPGPPLPPPPADAYTLEFRAAEIPAVRQATLAWARAAGMMEDDAQELLIAVYEIVSNAVEHGGGRGVGRFWSEGSQLVCEVWSPATIPDPLAGYRPPATTQDRGRGLWLARQICQQVDIHNHDGATVRLQRSIR